ncbi:hypothetical protein elemo19C_phanotate61 [Flavobacterium phage vB_FspP_elemoA_1-9C]|jgi:hypothetical protein|uniref:Uncharacterized protein n=4 Tax=Elemovirus TaxID=2948694 RepID=A0A7D7K0C9_9CAUD|nr:hypothetical protein KNV10_gp50 [Flavobacterium phage vB_FspP_elemoA_7-9A]YP_010108966.1 hypothetical protein KNV11_gp47 [Flavobacterium phage vB_FspP_elemoF_6-3D]YP_010109054.1 hypothetical protein KNV12_gp47 [Flavobacterium phage vB_FspP_elemoE_6-9C]YP_010109098.1 hypothetical protein KNV13_gp15 [Flavobacterium phage vB_FspP_elemoD_13-5B]QMP84680.1 hypothetical protein elemo131A_phanotate61 [Flavobacterium phage vB_FspP_elemoA_13-1A]QMP85043.1 hypothetical protein elemo159B_phanotate60 [F
MESNSPEFTAINVELFNRVDNFIDEDNNFELARMIYDSIDQLHNINKDDFMSTSIPISIIASIVCNQDEDVIYDRRGDVSLESNSIVFSDELDDLVYEGRLDEAEQLIEDELITRERYELLNEMKKYERNC